MSALGRHIGWTPRGRHRVPLPHLAGTAWLAWRRHRAAYRTVALLSVLAALWAVWERRLLVSDVHAYADACRRSVPRSCDEDVLPPLPRSTHVVFEQAPVVMRSLPPLVGALLGAPLFAQDMENGTHRLAWTQSVGRREWAAAKLATAAAVTAAAAVLLTAPVTWWWYTAWRGQHHTGLSGKAWRINSYWDTWSFFEYTGPAGFAHLLLALLIGAATGLLLRRTLPAVAVAAAATEGVQLALAALRPHLLTAHVLRVRDPAYPRPPFDGWHLGDGFVRADGSLAGSGLCARSPAGGFDGCLRAHGVVGRYSRDLRTSRFVPLQLIETGICLALAAALAAFCLWYVRRIAAR